LDGTEDDLIWNNEEVKEVRKTEEIEEREIVNLEDESADEN
jgi:hypothetical protein